MVSFDPKAYALELKEERPEVKRMTVQVVDDDLCLVIKVLDEEGETIGFHDTGLDGDEDTTEADDLADELVEALQSGRKSARVEAKRFDFDREPDDQWGDTYQDDEDE